MGKEVKQLLAVVATSQKLLWGPPVSPSLPLFAHQKTKANCAGLCWHMGPATWCRGSWPSHSDLTGAQQHLRHEFDGGAPSGGKAHDEAAPFLSQPKALFHRSPSPCAPDLGIGWAGTYLSNFGDHHTGKRSPWLWRVCDVSLRLFPNHHIKLQRFSSRGAGLQSLQVKR